MCCLINHVHVPVKSKLKHLPTAIPWAFEYLENFCSNSPSRGRKAVQMPHPRGGGLPYETDRDARRLA